MPPGIFINEFRGQSGEIRIPALGVVVCRMTTPALLRRREVIDPELGRFDLHAAVSYFNQHLWDDPDFEKEVVLKIGREPVKVIRFSRTTLVLETGRLRMEGVEPEWREQSQPQT